MKTTLSIIAIAAGSLLVTMPINAAEATRPVAKKSVVSATWPAETISGTIVAVDATNNRVVLKTSDGTPFDFDLTRHTQIKAGDHALAASGLSADVNKSASVRFVPERRGDMARSIHITG